MDRKEQSSLHCLHMQVSGVINSSFRQDALARGAHRLVGTSVRLQLFHRVLKPGVAQGMDCELRLVEGLRPLGDVETSRTIAVPHAILMPTVLTNSPAVPQ